MAGVTDLLSAGSGIIGSLINGFFGNHQQNKEFEQQEHLQQMANDFSETMWNKQAEFNREERELTQEWNLEQWNRENEYNSPQAQLERAMAAGINPNSVFGNGQYGSVQAPQLQTSAAQAGLAGAAGVGSVPSIANAMAGIGSNIIDNTGKLVDIVGQTIENRYKPMIKEEELKNLKTDVEKKLAETDYTKQQKDIAVKMCDIATKRNEKDLAKADEEIKAIQQNIENMKTQQELMSAQTQNIKAETTGVNLDNDLKRFQKTLRDTLKIDPYGPLGLQLLALWKEDKASCCGFVSDIISLILGEKPEDEDNGNTGIIGNMPSGLNLLLGGARFLGKGLSKLGKSRKDLLGTPYLEVSKGSLR